SPPAKGKDTQKAASHIAAERLRHGAIFRRGAQDTAVIGPLQEAAEPGSDRDCRRDHQQIIYRNTEVRGVDRAVNQIAAVERARVGAPEELEHVLEHEYERKG